MPFNGQCEDIFPQFRAGSSDIMSTLNLKNAGYQINISVGLL